MSEKFDVTVIGGGPGGYVAAIRAAQLGLKVACVEKRGSLGGTCLNVGCIPSKALLESSHLYAEAQHGMAQHGVKVKVMEFDLSVMQSRKTGVVDSLCKGIEGLFRKNKVTYVKGSATITAPGKVSVALLEGGSALIETDKIIIATGSDVVGLPGVPIDEKRILSSTGALALSAIPKSMIVIGAGAIGLEMGSVWRRLGTQVAVIEYLDRIIPGMDGGIARDFQRILEKQGFIFRLGTKVTGAKVTPEGVSLTIEPAKGGAPEEARADVVLVAIGRKPYTSGLGLENVGVKLDQRGRIETNPHFETGVPGIYAIGDVIAGPMLAHKAEDEGVAVAEIIAGQAGHVNYDAIPAIIYTSPEVAAVGKTEEELKAAGIAYNVGSFPFMANSRARAVGQAEGAVKILACAKTDKVLGVHILGPDAGTIIAEAVVAMEFSASAEDIARICHAHPTLNEAVKEAAFAVDKRAIHI